MFYPWLSSILQNTGFSSKTPGYSLENGGILIILLTGQQRDSAVVSVIWTCLLEKSAHTFQSQRIPAYISCSIGVKQSAECHPGWRRIQSLSLKIIRPWQFGNESSCMVSFELVERHIYKATERTSPATHLRVMSKTKLPIVQQFKDVLAHMSQSFLLYQFTCSCSASYIGHTTRWLCKWMAEHVPVSLSKGIAKLINSAMLQRFVDSKLIW